MARKPTVSSRKSWKKAAFKGAALLALIVVADQSGLLLRLTDSSLRRAGEYAYHAAPDVEVRVSPRICRLFALLPTGVSMQAITLGRTVFVPHAAGLPLPPPRVAHELQHVRQWERLGVLGFGLAYTFWQLVGGYDNNPFEQAAESPVS
jgi:hypothetical protein